MNRRQFTRSSALLLAATRLPAIAQAELRTKPVGFAAVGLGSISDIFMKACANSTSVKITALVTGHPSEKGSKYAERYGIPKSSIYTSRYAEHRPPSSRFSTPCLASTTHLLDSIVLVTARNLKRCSPCER